MTHSHSTQLILLGCVFACVCVIVRMHSCVIEYMNSTVADLCLYTYSGCYSACLPSGEFIDRCTEIIIKHTLRAFQRGCLQASCVYS